MKNIFILAYARGNLGDDLFIEMLLKKYPNVSFSINIADSEHAALFEKFPNITVVKEKERNLTKENAKEYDGYIYVGGSIFMEGGVVYNITEEFLEFLKECKKNNIPFCYVSSNFGPAYTQEYVNLAREVYHNCTDICFRDIYSYNLFADIPTVRYAPDLAFTYKTEVPIEKQKNTVGISMIDLSIRKQLIHQEENYYNMLIKNIGNYINDNKQIYLFSFCKYEGDENSIQKLMKKMPEQYKKHINCINYEGDMEKFIQIYASMEYMICARFHAMILSTVFEQKCRIMSYSDKIDNVVEDLKLFNQNIIHFNHLNTNTQMPLSEFEQVEAEKMQDIVQKANAQLLKVDEIMNSKIKRNRKVEVKGCT